MNFITESDIDCLGHYVDWSNIPEENGCENNKLYGTVELKKDSIIDRFGPETGAFFSPVLNIETPYTYSARSIPYIKHSIACEKSYNSTYNHNTNNNYHQYKVIKKFRVFQCAAAPSEYYNTEGGAFQYFLYKLNDNGIEYSQKGIQNIQDLITGGYIEERPKEFINYPEFGVFKDNNISAGNKYLKKNTLNKKKSKNKTRRHRRKSVRRH